MSRGDRGCTCRYQGEGEWSTCDRCRLEARVEQLEAENAQLRAFYRLHTESGAGAEPTGISGGLPIAATCKADLQARPGDLDLQFGFGPGGVP